MTRLDRRALPFSEEQILRAALVGLCLLCACGAEGQPATQDATGGVNSSGAGTAGAGTAGGGNAGAGTAGADTAGAASAGGMPSGNSGAAGAGGTAAAGLTLTSPAFTQVPGCSVENPVPCAVFPDENVSYMGNANVSPELRWSGAPPGTQSFAVVLLDATYGQAHWVLWNIPPNVTMLAANVPKDTAMLTVPAGARQANAIFATTAGDGYFGPHVPCNVFQFELYALSVNTFTPTAPESAGLVLIELQELDEPVLGVARLVARSNDYSTSCE